MNSGRQVQWILIFLYFFGCKAMFKGIILFCPAGRKQTMEIQVKYVVKLMEHFSEFISRYDIWDVAWKEEDSKYLGTLPQLHPKIRVLYTPFMEGGKRSSEIASKQFAFIYSTFYRHEIYKDYIFVKLDDDIVFVDVLMFPHFIYNRALSSSFLLAANVVNNDVDLFYQFYDIHVSFISNYKTNYTTNRMLDAISYDRNKYLSINFISFFGSDLFHINHEFSNGIGADDEYRLANYIPRNKEVDRDNMIELSMTVVHYSFGHDTVHYSLDVHSFIPYYHQISEEYFQSLDEEVTTLKSVPAWEQFLQLFPKSNESQTTGAAVVAPNEEL
jgi:hypothetical protein